MSDSIEFDEDAAVDQLCSFLIRHEPNNPELPTPDVAVYTYRDVQGGLRISEISYSWKRPDIGARAMSGASYMRSGPECLGAICAAEDFLLTRGMPIETIDAECYYDPEQEAEQALLWHLLGANDDAWNKLPQWEDRR